MPCGQHAPPPAGRRGRRLSPCRAPLYSQTRSCYIGACLLNALYGVARREYFLVRALAGVSFKLESGGLVGYIGPKTPVFR